MSKNGLALDAARLKSALSTNALAGSYSCKVNHSAVDWLFCVCFTFGKHNSLTRSGIVRASLAANGVHAVITALLDLAGVNTGVTRTEKSSNS